jgi:hypothetical protein
MALENLLFEQTFMVFPLGFMAVLVPWVWWAWYRRRRTNGDPLK